MSLEEYEIVKELGSGTYSTVYKVRNKLDNFYYAMKEIKFDRLSSKEKEYTKTEVKILKQIQHPNIIKFEKCFSTNNSFYIIMELATCGDLQNKISEYEEKSMHFSIETIWSYTYQIVLGLQVLHDNKILHRDIKASNIFIMENDVVKIGDFNIGKEVLENLVYTKIGTPVMMSPEVWNGENYNFKTDIWALGCLVYHMAALKLPFHAENYAALYIKISKMKYEKILNYPKSLGIFIGKLLKKNPKQRPCCYEILKYDEFKHFKPESNETKCKSTIRKESKKKSFICKPKLMNNANKDTFSIRKKIREFSPSLKYKLGSQHNFKSYFEDKFKPTSLNKSRIISPQPQYFSPNKKVFNKLFKEKSLQILDSIDIGNTSTKNSFHKLNTPRKSFKSRRNSFKDTLNSLIQDSSFRGEPKPEPKQLNPLKFKKSSGGCYIINEPYSLKKYIKKKRSLVSIKTANLRNSPLDLHKVYSDKKFSVPLHSIN
jgi:serine/threonine protein kinase